ncbi:MAG: phosphoenolpyruvate--protein phosphotransferase [Micropepsaceae bacterium]
MAEHTSAQDRLNKLVSVIAANMVAEVCSIYLLRAGSVLELFATEGLSTTAVHNTRLNRGEGLVGFIIENATPLNLTDAQAHPKFSYRPETGEDPYKSFLGVPIVRGEQVIGVLTVQNLTARHYDEEEVEALLTVAMVLAEVVAQGGLYDLGELEDITLSSTRPLHFKGEGIADGMAIGPIFLHEPRVKIERMIADDPVAELQRLEFALLELRASVDEMLESSELNLAGETRDVIEAYRLFANDQGWRQRLRDAVRSGLTAEAAVERVQDETRARMNRTIDPYLRERLHDFDDLARRLVRHLVRGGSPWEAQSPLAGSIVVARAMGPAELLDYGSSNIAGLVVEEASRNSHIVIVARSLDLPFVGGLEGIGDAARTVDTVIVDGETGDVHLRPASDMVAAFRAKQALRAQRVAQFAAIREEEAITRDGVRIRLHMNAGLLVDLPHLEESGADGIGLFRTELQFLVGAAMPALRDQIAFYRKVFEAAGTKPVVFRTLDLGGDKVPSYGRRVREQNPALGWRAIRVALDRPALLRYQVRALISAAEGRRLRLLLPMITEVSEFERARVLIDRELDRAARKGVPKPEQVDVGSMVEVPSLLFELDQIISLADFISVGSNDLLQFIFAADRSNPTVSRRYDSLSPAVLNLVRHLVTVAKKAGCLPQISVCGEMAGKPLEAMALIGLGLTSLSMQATSIGPVKMLVRSLDTQTLGPVVDGLCASTSGVRDALTAFAEEHKIEIGRVG